MNILYIGDIMGRAGRETVQRVLPSVKTEFDIDFAIAQAENMSDSGKAPTLNDINQMLDAGVDFFTGGNHSFSAKHATKILDDPNLSVIRPANVMGQAGLGYKIVNLGKIKILVGSFLGQTVGMQTLISSNPLLKADEILVRESDNFDISIFNFHGDYSSEKRVFGYYLDGRVNAVIGDHWHVPTADAMILPAGTGHITDVGMTGALHSSLGVKTDVIIDRWLNDSKNKNELEQSAPYQLNAVLVEIDDESFKTKKIIQIQRILDK